jgi:hypothetical protein
MYAILSEISGSLYTSTTHDITRETSWLTVRLHRIITSTSTHIALVTLIMLEEYQNSAEPDAKYNVCKQFYM